MVSIFGLDLLMASPNFQNWKSIDGNVVWFAKDDAKMRNVHLANVFHPLIPNDYEIKVYYEQKSNEINIQCADFHIEKSNVLFRVGYYESFDIDTGGQDALEIAMGDYLTSMMPPWFKQYANGSGNICLVPINADVTRPTTVQNVLFIRDNVAVRVQNLRGGGDIFTFAKWLDECILSSFMEEDGEVQELKFSEFQSTIKSGEQQGNALFGTIINQTFSPEETAPSSVSTEAEKTISLKSFNNIWLYLGIGFIFLFAFFYFFRKKPKQGNP